MLKTKLKSFLIASLIGGTLLIPGKVQVLGNFTNYLRIKDKKLQKLISDKFL